MWVCFVYNIFHYIITKQVSFSIIQNFFFSSLSDFALTLKVIHLPLFLPSFLPSFFLLFLSSLSLSLSSSQLTF